MGESANGVSYDAGPRYRVVMVGSAGAGKTALVRRLKTGSLQQDIASTVGVTFEGYAVTVGGQTVNLQIWDTAGQERFRSLAKSYVRGAVGCLVVFSLADIESFQAVEYWIEDVRSLAVPNVAILMVGNKSDLVEERLVSQTEAESFAARMGVTYMESSALNGNGVVEAFCGLAEAIHSSVASGAICIAPRAKLQFPADSQPAGRGCC